MQEPLAVGSDNLHLSYHQFMVTDYDVPNHGPAASSVSAAHQTGLATTEPGIVLILSGIHTGYVSVTAAAHDEPPALDLASWEDVMEVSVRSTGGRLLLAGLMEDPSEELPNLASAGPGDYRVRIHAKGRDAAVDLVAEEPVEDYLIAAWPEKPSAPIVHKMTSRYSSELRAHL